MDRLFVLHRIVGLSSPELNARGQGNGGVLGSIESKVVVLYEARKEGTHVYN